MKICACRKQMIDECVRVCVFVGGGWVHIMWVDLIIYP